MSGIIPYKSWGSPADGVAARAVLFSTHNGILLQILLSLSLLQGKTLFDQGVLYPFRTQQRLLPASHLSLELLHN